MATSLAGGQTYGHYRLVARVGEGAMGVVYRAHDEVLERDVALKLLRPGVLRDTSTRRRFRQEALTLARLNHPNIETLHGFETDGDVDFLVMEYVPGITLADRLVQGPLRQPELINIAIQIASAVAEAHDRGVVHRDLKPGNIMVRPSGQVKVLDFGLAQLLPTQDQPTQSDSAGSLAGTLPYVAPEQLHGSQPDRRTDVHALGVVLYEMATGRRPHAQSSVAALVEAILKEEPAPLRSVRPEIPAEFEAIVCKAMDKDPGLRYQSARELAIDLQRLVSSRNLELIAQPRPRSLGLLWPAVAAVACLLIAFVWILVHRATSPPSPAPAPRARVVAVLPFEAIGANPENQALCRGLTELLTARLAQIGNGVEVIPTSEVQAQGVTSATDARRKLGATLVVEGSWNFAAGNQLTYSLVDANTRRSLNAAVVQPDLRNLLTTEDEAAGQLLAMMNLEVPRDTRTPAQQEVLAHPDAWQYYVRGRGYLLQYADPQNLRSAIALFNTAIDIEPSFALAWAGLGEAYWREFQDSRNEEFVPKAIEASAKAVRLNDKLAPVHVTLGTIDQGRGDYEAAVREFERALELDPESDAAYRGLAASYASLGKMDRAESAYLRAIAVRRDYWGSYSALGGFYYTQARYDDAAAQFRRAIDFAPENARGYTNLGGIYYLQGNYKQAQELYEKSITLEPNYRAYSNLGTLYFYNGRYADAARMFEKALQLNDTDSRVWRNLASAYYWAPGEREKARAAYGKAASLIDKELQINPRDSTLMLQLADCESMLGHSAKAVALVHQALALSPDSAEDLHLAAGIEEQVGNRQAALELLGKAIRAGYSIAEIERDPALQQLRADPRYNALAHTQSTSPAVRK